MIQKIGMILFFGCWALQAFFPKVGDLSIVIAVGALIAVVGLILSK